MVRPKKLEEQKPTTWRERVSQMTLVLRHIPGTFRMLWKAAPGGTLLLAAVTLVQALVPAAIAWVAKLIIDGVVRAQASHDAQDREAVLMAVAVELGLVFLQTVLHRTNWLTREVVGAHLKRDLSMRVLRKALELELRHFEDSKLYDKMQNARREADTRPLNLVLEVFAVVQNTITLATYGVLIFSMAPWALLILVLASIPSFISEVKFAGETFRIMSWRAPEVRRLNYLEWILTRDSTVKEVKVFGLGELVLGRYLNLCDKIVLEDRRLARRKALWGTLLGLVSVVAFYGCYAFIADQAALARVTLGDMVFALAAFRQGQGAFQSILSSVGSMVEDALFMSNLFGYLDVEARGEIPRTLPNRHPKRGPGENAIELRGVHFKYPGSDEIVLDGIDLTVKPGERIALVGENGAGKTTLVKLLMRLYEPTAGSIYYGGVDVRDMDPMDLRARFGAVFQDFVKYQLVLRENIGVGDVPHLDEQAHIERAAQRGGPDVIVEKVCGWDQMLCGWFEEGNELSGGQWQKIALSRGFMREEAEVLILDEPTASVDARAEAELFGRIRALAEHRTTFLISHRFSTVRMADRILVLDKGKIAEQGSHEELVALGGRYAQLFQLQARGYQ